MYEYSRQSLPFRHSHGIPGLFGGTRFFAPRRPVVLANLKTTLIIVIAVLLWDKSISWISVLGFVIFFGGLFAYSYLTFKSRNRATPTKPTEAPKEGEAAKAPKETTKLVSS